MMPLYTYIEICTYINTYYQICVSVCIHETPSWKVRVGLAAELLQVLSLATSRWEGQGSRVLRSTPGLYEQRSIFMVSQKDIYMSYKDSNRGSTEDELPLSAA